MTHATTKTTPQDARTARRHGARWTRLRNAAKREFNYRPRLRAPRTPRTPHGLNTHREVEVEAIDNIAKTMNLDWLTAKAIWLARR